MYNHSGISPHIDPEHLLCANASEEWRQRAYRGKTPRKDKQLGIRCVLYGPSGHQHVSWYPPDPRKHAERGYAPEYVRYGSGEKNVDYTWQWDHLGAGGIHHYVFYYRRVFDEGRSSCSYEVLAAFSAGPFRGQQRWIKWEDFVKTPQRLWLARKIKGDRHEYRPVRVNDYGVHLCEHVGLAEPTAPTTSSEPWLPNKRKADEKTITRRRGRPRKDLSAEDEARGVTDQDLDDLEFGVRCVLRSGRYLDGVPDIARFTLDVGRTQQFHFQYGFAPSSIVRSFSTTTTATPSYSRFRGIRYVWKERIKGVHYYDYAGSSVFEVSANAVLRASTGRMYHACIGVRYYPTGSSTVQLDFRTLP